MDMKEKITSAALSLFNKEGVQPITTNHIIDDLGISPGTFYYHFKNKEEVIRSIFQLITMDFSKIFSFPLDSFKDLINIFKKTWNLYYKYRFFYLEITTILLKDPGLHNLYINNQKLKFIQQQRLYKKGLELGIFIGIEDEIDYILKNLWIINDFWITHEFITNKRLSRECFNNGLKQTIYFLKPYINKRYSDEIRNILE